MLKFPGPLSARLMALVLVSLPCSAEWEHHTVRQLNGRAPVVSLPARAQTINLNWGRSAQMPYVAYLADKDELLILFLSERPTRAMLTRSRDGGNTWSAPEYAHRGADGKPDFPGCFALTYHGGAKVTMVPGEGTVDWNLVSADLGQSWRKVPRQPAFPGQPFIVWDPWFSEPSSATQRLIETGYISVGEWEKGGYSQGVIRFSEDGGETWSETTKVPQWRGFNEVVVTRAKNGNLVAACRSDAPARFHKLLNDNYSGLGVSISKDNGRNWSAVNMLYEWGRHHPGMVVLPNGDIVMSYAVRRGYPDTPDGFPQMGVEAVVSHDHGQTWDLDHRYLLDTYTGLVKGPDGPYIAQTQSTGSVLLRDGSILTVYGGAARAIRTTPGASEPRDTVVVKWRPGASSLNQDGTIRNAPFNSDVRNRFDLNRLNGVPGKVNLATAAAGARISASVSDQDPVAILKDDYTTNLLTLKTIPAWIELRWDRPHTIDEVRIHPGAPAVAKQPETERVPLDYRLQFERDGQWIDLIPPVQDAPRYRDFDPKLRNPMTLGREFAYVHTFAPTSLKTLRLYVTQTSDEGRRQGAQTSTLVPEAQRETILRQLEIFEALRQ